MKLVNAEPFIRDLKAMKSMYDAILLDGMIKALEEAPAVEDAPVVPGRWVEKEDIVASYLEDCTEVFYECSVCKEQNDRESPYCSNCGVKMEL